MLNYQLTEPRIPDFAEIWYDCALWVLVIKPKNDWLDLQLQVAMLIHGRPQEFSQRVGKLEGVGTEVLQWGQGAEPRWGSRAKGKAPKS